MRGGSIWGKADKRVAEGHERVGEQFWNFCFEMVHFGAKVNNAWFSLFRVYSEKTDLRLIHFCHNFGGGVEFVNHSLTTALRIKMI